MFLKRLFYTGFIYKSICHDLAFRYEKYVVRNFPNTTKKSMFTSTVSATLYFKFLWVCDWVEGGIQTTHYQSFCKLIT